MYMRKLTLLASTFLLVSSLNAASHTVASPDSYPYPSVTTDKKGRKINNDGGIILPQEFKVTHVYHSPFSGKNHNFGTKATKEQIKAWDTDTRPDGKGLPVDGQMSVLDGSEVYIAKCATCHGDFGEGVDRFPVLAGGEGTLTLHPETGGDEGPLKTVGSYAPYISPFFWYIQTAMPLSAPKSLTNSEVYGILGYILQLSEIQVNGEDIDDETIIDRDFILAVHMPNEKGFEYNNLRVSDTKNTRCMKNCIDVSKMKVMHIVTDGTIVEPEFGEERWFYGEAKEQEAGGATKAAYEVSCAGCHDSGIAGSPKVGDKEAWLDITKQSLEDIMDHAINGFNSMPPKGGDTSLDDKLVEDIVKYMLEESK
jgi:cytochrome c